MRGGNPHGRLKDLRDTLPAALRDNPFFQIDAENHYIPPWDRIKLKHIIPALDHAFAIAEQNLDDIRKSRRPATFSNTVEAMETAGELANYFMNIMSCLPPGKDPDAYEEIQDYAWKKYSDFYNNMFIDRVLFDRLKAVTESPAYARLKSEEKSLCDMYRHTFVSSGISLDKEKKDEIRKLERKIAGLEVKSQSNMRNAESAYTMIVRDRAKLDGLSPFALAAAAEKAKMQGHRGAWAFGIDSESYTTFMQSVHDRGLRKRLWRAYISQAAHGRYDNRAVIMELTALQQQHARLKGYRNVAQHILSEQMAGDSHKVARFLNGLRRAAKPVAAHELETLRAFARQKDNIRDLKPWDQIYYQEALKRATLGYDAEALRPYFELENVLSGVLRHMGKMLGVKIEETKDYPVYHPDLRAFNVTNARSGAHMGVIFMDLFDRPGKAPGGGWNMMVLPQGMFQGRNTRPVDMIVTKFAKGADGAPTLLRHDSVVTLFHEMGHAMHNMVSRCRYASFAGTNVKLDFAEFPSQLQENWAWQPEVLRTFARHYQTGEVLSDDIIERMQRGRKFLAGMVTLSTAMNGWLDLSWYRAKPESITSVEDFEKARLSSYRVGPANAVASTVSPSFSHLFGGGYEACYYSYQWAQVMEADVFALFQKKGLYNRSLCNAFRHALEKGGSVEPDTLFRSRRGRDPRQSNFLRREGLTGTFNYSAAFAAPEAANDNEAAPARKEAAAPKPRQP